MPVKTLTDTQKQAVLTVYKSKTKTIKEIAHHLNTSERTVVRVLNEMGEYTEKQLAAMKTQQELLHAKECISRGPTTRQIIKACMEMEEGTWAALLKDIVTARVAKAANTHVQTAMLNIENKVKKNAN